MLRLALFPCEVCTSHSSRRSLVLSGHGSSWSFDDISQFSLWIYLFQSGRFLECWDYVRPKSHVSLNCWSVFGRVCLRSVQLYHKVFCFIPTQTLNTSLCTDSSSPFSNVSTLCLLGQRIMGFFTFFSHYLNCTTGLNSAFVT